MQEAVAVQLPSGVEGHPGASPLQAGDGPLMVHVPAGVQTGGPPSTSLEHVPMHVPMVLQVMAAGWSPQLHE